MGKKTDWNKRMQVKEIEKRRKKNEGFLVNEFSIEEVLDVSGEVLTDTIIKFSFSGLLIYMSISDALKFNKILTDILSLKK